MKTSNSARAVGVTLGLALFVGTGLMLMIAASTAASDRAMTPGPIDSKVVAPAEQLGRAFEMVAAHVRPCVVSVVSERVAKQPDFSFPFGDDFLRQFFGNQFRAPQSHHQQREYSIHGMGSGMILDKEGHILTNYHVVRDVDDIQVVLADKRTFKAEIVGTDPKTDVAIIRIKGHVPDDLPPVSLGDSDAMKVGDMVIAIGAPFGLQQTVTEGIISATGRSDVGIAEYEDFLQTDAQINPGNSGGPLVNMRGEVIGMNTAIASNTGGFEGAGFSIPSDMIKTMLPTLIKGKTIVRGQLGVGIQEITPALAPHFGLSETKGVLVSQVNEGSAADKAGIKVDDVIVRYNGQDVQGVRELRDMVAGTAPGTTVKIGILRDGKPQTLTITVGKQEAETAAATPSPSAESSDVLSKLGLTVQTLTPGLAKQLGVEADKGAVITDVDEGSLAGLAGLQKGDVIVQADHQPVESDDQLQQVLAKAKDKDSVLLLVKRQKGSFFVAMQMK
jgi:serine protease Do